MAFAQQSQANIVAGWISRLGFWLEQIRVDLERRRRFVQVRDELYGMSDRDLADIGINRLVVEDLAWQAAKGA